MPPDVHSAPMKDPVISSPHIANTAPRKMIWSSASVAKLKTIGEMSSGTTLPTANGIMER